MFKKYSVVCLMGLVLNLAFCVSAFAETKEEKAVKFAEKVKANVIRLGTGQHARIEVKLKDGSKLKGYIGQINEDTFMVVNEKTGVATEVTYSQTKQIKGNNLSTGVKIAIGVAIFFAVFVVIGVLAKD